MGTEAVRLSSVNRFFIFLTFFVLSLSLVLYKTIKNGMHGNLHYTPNVTQKSSQGFDVRAKSLEVNGSYVSRSSLPVSRSNISHKPLEVNMSFVGNKPLSVKRSNASQKLLEVNRRNASQVTAPSSKARVGLYPYIPSFTIDERDTCTRNSSRIRVVVVVCSAMRHREQRNAIRETWGSVGNMLQLRARLVFILGKSTDKNLQKEVLQESAKFHDIIQADFLDTYRNLTLKSISLVNWVRQYCMFSTFVVKADDDVFVNISRLNDTLRKLPAKSLTGALHSNSPVVRDPKSHWYVPPSDYPAKVYPDYFIGAAYVISTDLIPGLYNATLHTLFFFLEDVYITGMCTKELNLKRIRTTHFLDAGISSTNPACPSVIVRMNYNPQNMRKVWKSAVAPCKQKH